MKITLKYFGIIAEIMDTEKETITIDSNSINLEDIKNILNKKNSSLNEQEYKIAINHSIADHNITINNNDVISLLPPFSGG
jgi:molybdopterin converting factor small subunit